MQALREGAVPSFSFSFLIILFLVRDNAKKRRFFHLILCLQESINRSLLNLLTYPWIKDKVAERQLVIHGGYYDFTNCTFEKWSLDHEEDDNNSSVDNQYPTKNHELWSWLAPAFSPHYLDELYVMQLCCVCLHTVMFHCGVFYELICMCVVLMKILLPLSILHFFHESAAWFLLRLYGMKIFTFYQVVNI